MHRTSHEGQVVPFFSPGNVTLSFHFATDPLRTAGCLLPQFLQVTVTLMLTPFRAAPVIRWARQASRVFTPLGENVTKEIQVKL